jgi:hypothetical protein
MQAPSWTRWKLLLWSVSIYHGVLGVVMLVSGEQALRLIKLLAGMTLTGSQEMGIVGEILGCYLIAFALTMASAALDPVKNRTAVSIGAVLCLLRVVQRVIFAGKVMEVFQVPPLHYWLQGGLVLVVGLALGRLRRQLNRAKQWQF